MSLQGGIDLVHQDSTSDFQAVVYFSRWYMLSMFCALEMANALMWVTYAPISDVTQHYFEGTEYSTPTAINMFANVFLIFFLPGTICASLTTNKYGLRVSLIVGGVITAAGALLRVFAAQYKNDIGNAGAYWLMLLGQSLASIAQPYFLNMSSLVASTWFPINERDLATVCGAMSSPIGNAIGSYLPVLFVYQTTSTNVHGATEYHTHGMMICMLVQFILCMLPLIVAYFFYQEAPLTPPSLSQYLKGKRKSAIKDKESLAVRGPITTYDNYDSSDNRNNNNSMNNSQTNNNSDSKYVYGSHSNRSNGDQAVDRLDVSSPLLAPSSLSSSSAATAVATVPSLSPSWRDVLNDTKTLLYDPDYMLLFCSFSIGSGFFCAILTLVNQMIMPFGYSNNDAGVFGVVFIIAGVVGSYLCAKLIEKYRNYRTFLKGINWMILVCSLWFLAMLYKDNYWPLLFSYGALGFFLCPLTPIAMANSAECTYPISEELSMGLLFTGANIIGFALIFACQILLDYTDPLAGDKTGFWSPFNIFYIAAVITQNLFLVFFKGQYKRLNQELF